VREAGAAIQGLSFSCVATVIVNPCLHAHAVARG